jgi:hypothetical protein
MLTPLLLLLPVFQADAVTAAKLKAAAGLAYLDNRRYKLAARAFVEVSPELSTSYSDVSGYIAAVFSPLLVSIGLKCKSAYIAAWCIACAGHVCAGHYFHCMMG